MTKLKKEESKVYNFTSEKIIIEERISTSTNKTTDIILEIGKIYHVSESCMPVFAGKLIGYDTKAQTLRFDTSKEFESTIVTVPTANMKYISGCDA